MSWKWDPCALQCTRPAVCCTLQRGTWDLPWFINQSSAALNPALPASYRRLGLHWGTSCPWLLKQLFYWCIAAVLWCTSMLIYYWNTSICRFVLVLIRLHLRARYKIFSATDWAAVKKHLIMSACDCGGFMPPDVPELIMQSVCLKLNKKQHALNALFSSVFRWEL